MVKLMSILRKKLFKDIRFNKVKFIATIIIVIFGVAFYVGLYSSYQNLRFSIDKVYGDLNFGDIWISIGYSEASEIVDRISNVKGIKEYEKRLVIEAPTSFEMDGEEFITGRLISIPLEGEPIINRLLVKEGRYPESPNEILVEYGFAKHHNITVGDIIYVNTGEDLVRFEIVGIAISPEYLWPAKTILEHMPDVLRRWGVFYIPEEKLQSIFGLDGLYNNIVFKIEDGTDPEAILDTLRGRLEDLGITEAITRRDQPSNNIISLSVDSLTTLAIAFPIFFLSVSAIATYMVLSRIIAMQTRQIGLLQALGYKKRTIVLHYLEYSLFIGIIGAILGIALGELISIPLTDMFASQLSLPITYMKIYPDQMAIGFGISLLFTSTAGIISSMKAVKLSLIEAMRYTGIDVKRIYRVRNGFLAKIFRKSLWRLPFRNIIRNPVRTVFTIFGIALGFTMIVVPYSFNDSMDFSIEDYFGRVQVYDVKAYFSKPYNLSIVDEVARWEGVRNVEPYIELYLRIEVDGESWTVLVRGLESDTELYRVEPLKGEGELKDGALLSKAFLFASDIKEGEEITIDIKPIKTMYWLEMNKTYEAIYNEVYIQIQNLSEQISYMESLYNQVKNMTFKLDEVIDVYYGLPYTYIRNWNDKIAEALASHEYTNINIQEVDLYAYNATKPYIKLLSDRYGYNETILNYYLGQYMFMWDIVIENNPDLLENYSQERIYREADKLLEEMTLELARYGYAPREFIAILNQDLDINNWEDPETRINIYYNLIPEEYRDSIDITTFKEVIAASSFKEAVRNMITNFEILDDNFTEYIDTLVDTRDPEYTAKLIADDIINDIISRNPPPPEKYTVEVVGFANDPAGLALYIDIDKAQKIFSLRNMTLGLLIDADEDMQENIIDRLYREYDILFIENSANTRKDWVEMLSLYSNFVDAIIAFGLTISTAIMFNSININIEERRKEYATMRTLGVRMKEIFTILTIENIILLTIGVLIGLPISIYTSNYLLNVFNSEFFAFDPIIYNQTYLIAVALLTIILFITIWLGVKSIKRIDLPRVIKEIST